MMVEMKQRQAEVDKVLEEEKAKLKMLQAQMDVNAAAAHVRVYNQMEGNIDAGYYIEVPTAKTVPAIITTVHSTPITLHAKCLPEFSSQFS